MSRTRGRALLSPKQETTLLGAATGSIAARSQTRCICSHMAELTLVDTCHCCTAALQAMHVGCQREQPGSSSTLGEGAAGDEQRHLGAGGGADQAAHRLRRPDHGQVEGAGAVGVRHQRHLRGLQKGFKVPLPCGIRANCGSASAIPSALKICKSCWHHHQQAYEQLPTAAAAQLSARCNSLLAHQTS